MKFLKKKGWYISLSFPVIIIIALSLFDLINYYISDDWLLNFISMGGNTGVPDEHLIFVNCIIGYVLKGMYTICSSINWYGIMYLVAILLCVYTLWYILNKYTTFIKSLIIALIIELFMLFFLTFTIIAYLCMGIAVIGYIEYITNEESSKYNWIKTAVIVMLFVLGYMIRSDTLFSFIALAVPLFIFSYKKINKSRLVLLTLLMAVLTLSAYSVNKYTYNSDFWKEYSEYNLARSNMYDYPNAEYEKRQKEYLATGLSENDFKCAGKLIFADREVFSKEKLDAVFNVKTFSEKYNFNVIEILAGMIKTKESWVCLLVTLLLIVFDSGKKRKYYIIQSLFTFGMVAALFFRNRPVLRVIAPIYMVGILFMLYTFLKNNKIEKDTYKRVGIYVFILSLSALVVCYGGMAYRIAEWNHEDRETNRAVYDYLEKHRDNLYVASGYDRNPIIYNKPVLDVSFSQTDINLISLGDWDIYNNIYYNVVDEYDVTHRDRLILDIVEDDNVLCLTSYSDTDNIDMIKQYIEEHTKRKVKVVLEDKIEKSDVAIYNLKYIK